MWKVLRASRDAAWERGGRGTQFNAHLGEKRPKRHENGSICGCKSGTGRKALLPGQGGSSVARAEGPAVLCRDSRGWMHTRLLINTPDTHYKKNQAEPQLNTNYKPSRWRGERQGPPTLLAERRCKLWVMPSLPQGFSRLLHCQAPALSSPQLVAFSLGHLPAS